MVTRQIRRRRRPPILGFIYEVRLLAVELLWDLASSALGEVSEPKTQP
jgi:hypothetical protein